MSINLNDIPLYPFLEYFNRATQEGKFENAPVYIKKGVIYPTNPYLDSENMRYVCEEDQTDIANPDASDESLWFNMLSLSHGKYRKYSEKPAYITDERTNFESRTVIFFNVIDNNTVLKTFKGIKYTGTTYDNVSFQDVEIFPLVENMQKLKNGKPVYIDYLGIETTNNTNTNSFYKHQQTLRDRFYKLSNTSGWINNENFNREIGILQKTSLADTSKNKYQLAYWVQYNERITYTKVSNNTSISPIKKYLSNGIYELEEGETQSEVKIHHEPILLNYLNNYKNIEAAINKHEFDWENKIYKEGINTGIYFIKPYYLTMPINSKTFNIDKFGTIKANWSVSFSKDVYTERTESVPIEEIKREWRGSGTVGSSSGYWYSYRTGNILGYEERVITEKTSTENYNYSKERDLNISDLYYNSPYIEFEFDLQNKLNFLSGATIHLVLYDIYNNSVTLSGTIGNVTSNALSTYDVEIGGYKGVITPAKENNTYGSLYMIKLYLNPVNKNYLDEMLCKLSLANDGYADSYAVSPFKITVTTKKPLPANKTEYYFNPLDSNYVIQADYTYDVRNNNHHAYTDANEPGYYFSEISTPDLYMVSPFIYRYESIVQFFEDYGVLAEDVYYKLRGEYIAPGIFKNKRKDSFLKLLENIVTEDKENIDLNDLYTNSTSLEDFYNYAKGIDNFIKQDAIGKKFKSKIQNYALIDYNPKEDKIILTKNPYSEILFPEDTLYIQKEYDRELLQRLSEYEKFPMNYLYNKYKNKKDLFIPTYNVEVNKPDDDLYYKLSLKKENTEENSNSENRALNLIITSLSNYYLNNNYKSFKDISNGMYNNAIHYINDMTYSSNEYTEEKKVYSTKEFDINGLLNDLLITTDEPSTTITYIDEETDQEVTTTVVSEMKDKWNILGGNNG